MKNLDDYFSYLIKEISLKENEKFIFDENTFTELTEEFFTNNIVVAKGIHDYPPASRYDYLIFCAHPAAYQSFALLILALVFNRKILRMCLNLTNPLSDIKKIFIENYWNKDKAFLSFGFHEIPNAFLYSSRKVQRHPWLFENILPNDLPNFALTNLNDCADTDEDFKKRDVIRGFGSARGSVRLAELLLNISRPEQNKVEFDLEGEMGFRGVHPGSAEVRFALPGYRGWPDGL